jgi:hypothetical protein
MDYQTFLTGTVLACLVSSSATGDDSNPAPIPIESRMQHIRQADPREWAEFPDTPDARSFEESFVARENETEWTLRLRHTNVKQSWDVSLNGKQLTRLNRDENPMHVFVTVPPGTLRDGENSLVIATRSAQPDDVRLGDVELIPRPRAEELSQCMVELACRDASTVTALPCRFTILDQRGFLHDVGTESDRTLAVRTGVVFTATGTARFGLPPGRYRVIAARGPEYTIDQREIELAAGETSRLELSLRRVVETTGWVACDPHVHTLTHSGHGDATIEERLITICGEGIELPVATDHNKQINFVPLQRSMGLTRWFTPVVGNEVTTKWGHFNIFPAPADGPVPDHRQENWEEICREIRSVADPKVIILNHARDVHSGFRPFGIEHRHPLTGRQYNEWQLEANAMEVINSGAQQTDILRLPLDWMVNLNRGLFLTPVGSSDSHDVARHFVGQGRTYLRCDDSDPGQIDVAEAVRSFQDGRVIVSCGLFPQLTISDRFGPGDLVPPAQDGTVKAHVQVRGAPWAEADRFQIYCNGELTLEREFESRADGLKHQETVTLQVPPHDAHFELIVLGPGVSSLHWPIARPYQPDSPEWTALNFGMTGALWYDGNGDGTRNSAREIAEQILEESGGDTRRAISSLAKCHRSVCLQTAELLHLRNLDVNSPEIRSQAAQSGQHVREAFHDYWTAWRDSEIARSTPKP